MTLPFPTPSPSLLDPRFSLSRCVPDDIPEMTEVYLAAFRPTELSFWWPESEEALRRWIECRFGFKFADPRDQHFKVVDNETGKLIALSRWSIPEAMKGLEEGFIVYDSGARVKDQNLDGAEYKWTQAPPEGVNEKFYFALFDGIKVMGEKWGIKTKLVLSVLCTHPDYHRRGIGKALLEPVLALADSEGITAYVEAAQGAKSLYQRCGFKTVDLIECDTGKSGKDAKVVLDIMVREPRATAAS